MKHKITNKEKREANRSGAVRRNGSLWVEKLCGSPSNGAIHVGISYALELSFVRRGTWIIVRRASLTVVRVGNLGGCGLVFSWITKERAVVRSLWVIHRRSFAMGYRMPSKNREFMVVSRNLEVDGGSVCS